LEFHALTLYVRIARTATTNMYVWSLDTDEFRFVTEVWRAVI
jgi:hypothetical protein